jgi:hypothetical protein
MARFNRLPSDLLGSQIFRFSEMDQEIARLQAEVARLREAACRPYLRDVLAFCETVASERLDGFLVRDLAITDDHARHADMRRMTYADKVSIVPELTKRGYHVTQFPEDHSGGAPMMIDFDAPAPAAVEGLVLHRPDAPRFEVGAVVEAFVEPGAWVLGVVVRHWWRPRGSAEMNPYQIMLCPGHLPDDADFEDRLIYAPEDDDDLIRLPNPPPDAETVAFAAKIIRDGWPPAPTNAG